MPFAQARSKRDKFHSLAEAKEADRSLPLGGFIGHRRTVATLTPNSVILLHRLGKVSRDKKAQASSGQVRSLIMTFPCVTLNQLYECEWEWGKE